MMRKLEMGEFWGVDFTESDEYAFMRSREYTDRERRSFTSEYIEVLGLRSQKWAALLMRDNPLEKGRKLKRYIRQGIPFAFRGLVWPTISGAENLKSTMRDDLYDNLLKEEHNRAMTAIIALDINRTYPDNAFFQGLSRVQSELYNVLTAYAHHYPRLGYCQGLNYITGMILLATNSEEKSFWLLKVLVEYILKDYYTSTMEGVLVDIEVLSELVRMKLPDVHAHMTNLALPWGVVTAKWFTCLFADLLPVETVFRIWDCLFFEGSKIIFRVAITLIKKYRTQLLACKNQTEASECFKRMTRTRCAMNSNEFMKRIFREPGTLSYTTIQKLREKIRREKAKEKKKSSKRNDLFGCNLRISAR